MKKLIRVLSAVLNSLGRSTLFATPWGERVLHQIFREAEFQDKAAHATTPEV
jgi:hypothetical protein